MKRFPGWLEVRTSSTPSTMFPRTTTSNDRYITSIPTASTPNTHPPTNVPATTIFNHLARNPRPWILRRILWSENPSDLQGELKGIATFTPKPIPLHPTRNSHDDAGKDPNKHLNEMVYTEEGETAASGLRRVAGMRWTKKYIWRLAEGKSENSHTDDRIEVWFVKIPDEKANSSSITTATGKDTGAGDERDYIFHNLRFDNPADGTNNAISPDMTSFREPGFPLESISTKDEDFTTLTAHGHHLCINDTYQTAYSFRLKGEGSSMEVVRWASKHVVTGPKKSQVITNIYHRE